MKNIRVYPLDIIEANLKALSEQIAALELKRIMGKIEPYLYKYERMKLDEKAIYFKHCMKLSERVVNN